MNELQLGLIVGFCVGVIGGLGLAISIKFSIMCIRKHFGVTDTEKQDALETKRNSCTRSSYSANVGNNSPRTSGWSNMPQWLDGLKRKSISSACGIPKYTYKELQKATCDFTTIIGEGAFGRVYKAQMACGRLVAVKVLATNSKQGAMEFLTEVLLLGRLHHKNLVNLVGYSTEKGHMLVYVYMSNGSLASHLYDEKNDPLSWDLRVQTALDVARGLEYLHYGAFPPILHRDIKSSNILLDKSMRARVADFGLSRQETINSQSFKIKGTFGYLDPEYMSTRTFTKKSDVYSFGMLLFEIISGRNPQQGLMEYVELGAIDLEGNIGWGEIADSRLNGKFDPHELNNIASLAYKCVSPVSGKRPSMREVVLVLSQTQRPRSCSRQHWQNFSIKSEGSCFELDLSGTQEPSLTER
ncbi:hypothetical protein SLA2020_472310 [Shorea laevis]